MTPRFLLVSLVALGLTAACGSTPPTTPTPVTPPPTTPDPPAPPPPPPTLGITRILCFGDSMTAGTTSPVYSGLALTAGPSQSYPFKLQALLAARYTAQTIDLANAGEPGLRAVDANRADKLGSALRAANPELVLLLQGANDLNTPGTTDVAPVVAAMEDMVREAQAKGAQVMLATLPPQRVSPGSKAADPKLLTRYNDQLRQMASKKGAILIDLNAMLPLSVIGQDGLHPTDAGYTQMAEIFLDAIKSRFEVSAGS